MAKSADGPNGGTSGIRHGHKAATAAGAPHYAGRSNAAINAEQRERRQARADEEAELARLEATHPALLARSQELAPLGLDNCAKLELLRRKAREMEPEISRLKRISEALANAHPHGE